MDLPVPPPYWETLCAVLRSYGCDHEDEAFEYVVGLISKDCEQPEMFYHHISSNICNTSPVWNRLETILSPASLQDSHGFPVPCSPVEQAAMFRHIFDTLDEENKMLRRRLKECREGKL